MTQSPGAEAQILSTLVFPYLNHAVRMYESSYATRADIDNAMRFGCGYPAGPLTTLDELGLDTVRDALAQRYAVTGDSLHRPAELLERLVAQRRSFADLETTSDATEPQLRHAIGTVGVVGTGTMASGIVEVFARAGYDVVYVGRSEEKTAGVRAGIEKSLDRAVAKGRLDQAAAAEVLRRLVPSTSRADLAEVDLVVEAIAEDLEVKLALFRDLDRTCKPGTILATTTSSLPITQCADATDRPEWVIGMHFFNPAPVMKLVEVVTTELTAPEVDETVRALCAEVGKVAVSCGDRAGFIVNALLFPYLNDAVRLHTESGLGLEVIDAAIKEQAGFPMGPFQLLDVVGNDVSLAIQQELFAAFKEPGLAPAPLLEEHVRAGRLGRKTGRGFHDYR
jgi:3-hydroxybutyryl-CoA dehydrogenase